MKDIICQTVTMRTQSMLTLLLLSANQMQDEVLWDFKIWVTLAL